ncbi:MAG: hypothetical protein U0X73_10440 [Thermoanaerobaculia bacterium]
MHPRRGLPLPLLLVAAMLTIACGIEIVLYRSLDWLPKLPLALALALAGWGPGRRAPG